MGLVAAPSADLERSNGHPALWVALVAALGVAAAAATVLTGWDSPIVSDSEVTATVRGIFVAAYVAVGAYTWWLRPRSRLGPLVAMAGFLYTVTALMASERALPFTVGRIALAVLVVYFVYLFLCFPRDRLNSEFERRFVFVFGAATVVMWALVLLISDKLPKAGALNDCMQSCPDNPLRVAGASHAVTQAVNLTANGLTSLGGGVLIVVLLRKAASPALLRRRAIVPLLYAATLFTASFAVFSVLSQANANPNVTAWRVVTVAAALAIPSALLIGQFRGRVFAATNLWRLLGSAESPGLTPAWVE